MIDDERNDERNERHDELAICDGTDAELIAKHRAGDLFAGSEIVRKYRDRLEGYCRTYFYDFRDAGDRANDATCQALEKAIGTYEAAKGSFWNWSKVIAGNICIDDLRRSSDEKEHADRKKERLMSGTQAACGGCGMPVVHLVHKNGKVGAIAYNSDGKSHDKTCAADPGYVFIKSYRGKSTAWGGASGKDDIDAAADSHEADDWVVEDWGGVDADMIRCWIIQAIYERTNNLTDEQNIQLSEDGFYGFTYGDPPEEYFSTKDLPIILREIQMKYLSVMLDMANGRKFEEIKDRIGISKKELRDYFNRIVREYRKQKWERISKLRGRVRRWWEKEPTNTPVFKKLSDELRGWQRGTGTRRDPFKK